MKEILVTGVTLPEAYHKALLELHSQGEYSPCADWNTTQQELSMTIHVENPLAEPRISKLFIGGPKELEQYRQEMLYGILDFEVEKGNWAYTYHQRYADQMDFIIEELKRNPSSRRAVMLVRDKEADMKSSEPPCIQLLQFFVRNGKLDCQVTFRSNDACKATFMNAFALICLQEFFAQKLGLEVGTYTHRANSFHCYERDFALLEGYCKRLKETGLFKTSEVCYNYKDGWDELMADAEDEIATMVEELKGR